MTEPILFERLFGKTAPTKTLSHLIEFSGFEYSVEELADILDLSDDEIRNALSNFLDQKIIACSNSKFTFADDSNPKTAALAAYANAVIFENINAIKSEVSEQ